MIIRLTAPDNTHESGREHSIFTHFRWPRRPTSDQDQDLYRFEPGRYGDEGGMGTQMTAADRRNPIRGFSGRQLNFVLVLMIQRMTYQTRCDGARSASGTDSLNYRRFR